MVDRPQPVGLADLALQFMGEFARLQESIDELVSLYVETKARALVDYLEGRNVLGPNISDTQRVTLVLAMAAELETPGDLSKFRDVFHSAKEMRDFLGHSARMDQLGGDTLHIAKKIWTGPRARPTKGKSMLTVTRQQLITHLHNARWLRQHVHAIMAGSELTTGWFIGDQPIKQKVPPADPADWDGSLYVQL